MTLTLLELVKYITEDQIRLVNLDDKEIYCIINPKIWGRRIIESWFILFSSIQDCEVIRIFSDKFGIINIKIRYDKDSFNINPELVTLDNSPTWFYNEVHVYSK